MTAKTKPVHTLKCGRVSAAVWANATKESGVMHTVAFSRAYRNGQQWRDTKSFRQRDLLALAQLVLDAYHWLSKENKK